MTQSGGNNNVFPAFSGVLVQSLGLQGLPGACPSNLAASDIEYGVATSCVPSSINSVDAALAWFEENVACVLDPASILAAPDGYILVWDSTEMKLVPRTIGSALGSGLPGNSNNDVLLYNTLSMSYTPTSLLDWLTTNLPGQLGDAFNAVFPCNTPGQILSCTASGWAATSFLQSFNTGLPGTNNFDVVFWNAGTNSWATTDAGSLIGNNLPAALAAAYPCTTGDLLTCVGGQWQATTFQAAMTSGLPGTTASDILVWNGAQWVPQEEQTWLTTVLGPALGNQSITALGDVPATLGSPGQVLTTNAAATGTLWTTPATPVTTFVGLTDTPNTLTPNTFLQVNATGTGFDAANICTAIATCSISNLQDVPALGGPSQILRMNALGSALEFADVCAAIASCSITSLQDGPNALGTSLQILRMNLAGSDLEFADICTAIATCSITSLADGPPALGTGGQILQMNPAGTDLVFADFCTQLTNCSISSLSDTPGALGAAGQIFAVNPAGTAAIWTDFCAQLANCSITALSDTPAALGNPGEVLTMNAAGTATEWQGVTTGGALPTGATGDIVTYDAAGTTGVARTLPEYLDLYYPPPATSCNAQLTNDGTGWAVREGIPPIPANWAFPLAPASVGLELETNPANDCAEWVAPSHITGTFQIPGDFPTVQDFITWGSGRSVDVNLNVTAPQPGGINYINNGPTGKIVIDGNGNNMGEIILAVVDVNLSVGNAQTDSISVGQGTLYLNNIANVNNTNGVGVRAESGGRVLVTAGDLIVTGGGDNAILADSGKVRVLNGSVQSNDAQNASSIVIINSGQLFSADGIEVSNSGAHGIDLAAGGDLSAGTGTISSQNNASNGINMTTSTLSMGALDSLILNNNGAVGILAGAGSSVFGTAQSIEANNNGQDGISASTNVAISLVGVTNTLTIDGNQTGIRSSDTAAISFQGNGATNISNNTAVGVFTDENSSIVFQPTLAPNITGNNIGVLVSLGGLANLTGAAIAGNTADTNVPINALSADGSYINV